MRDVVRLPSPPCDHLLSPPSLLFLVPRTLAHYPSLVLALIASPCAHLLPSLSSFRYLSKLIAAVSLAFSPPHQPFPLCSSTSSSSYFRSLSQPLSISFIRSRFLYLFPPPMQPRPLSHARALSISLCLPLLVRVLTFPDTNNYNLPSAFLCPFHVPKLSPR